LIPGSRLVSLFICSKVYSIASSGCTPSSSCNKQVPCYCVRLTVLLEHLHRSSIFVYSYGRSVTSASLRCEFSLIFLSCYFPFLRYTPNVIPNIFRLILFNFVFSLLIYFMSEGT
jgi:hypothetical protein